MVFPAAQGLPQPAPPQPFRIGAAAPPIQLPQSTIDGLLGDRRGATAPAPDAWPPAPARFGPIPPQMPVAVPQTAPPVAPPQPALLRARPLRRPNLDALPAGVAASLARLAGNQGEAPTSPKPVRVVPSGEPADAEPDTGRPGKTAAE